MANELTDDDLTDEEEDLKLEPQQAGLAFRAEMWAMDTLLGYWPYLLGGIGIVLAAVFFYGQYSNYATNQQRASAKAVAQIEAKVPGGRIGDLAYMAASGETLDVGALVEAATKLEAVSASGPAKAEAMLKAAELYRIAEKPDDQRRALEAAAQSGTGVLSYVAESAIANLDLEAGNNDAATQRLQKLMDTHQDYLGEQAALDLGLVLEQLGKKPEAEAVYTKFLERWPESPRKEEVAQRKSALGEG
ncbi:MAG: tetratricopeptide repeat protein [Alphaproteobacteria bacterium]|nr:tetratricopeptide repeat protein [Alphaproteobacteria bacterium]